MRTPVLAIATLSVVMGASTGSGQRTPQCLHDELETSANRTRRERAVEWAHQINAAEAKLFGPRGGRSSYRPLDQLFNVPPAPEAFKLQFHVDDDTYAFSIKDTRDPCAYAVFSDQSGDVYEATPAPFKPRLKLLSQR
jgi:hypothetical protein